MRTVPRVFLEERQMFDGGTKFEAILFPREVTSFYHAVNRRASGVERFIKFKRELGDSINTNSD